MNQSSSERISCTQNPRRDIYVCVCVRERESEREITGRVESCCIFFFVVFSSLSTNSNGAETVSTKGA